MTQSTLTDTAKSAAQDAQTQIKQGARDAADSLRQDAVDHGEQSAEAAQRAADTFDAGTLQSAALTQLAASLEGMSQSLRDRSIEGLADDVAVFARRNPLLFLGGAAVAGFAAARFLKSSPVHEEPVPYDPWTTDARPKMDLPS